MKHVVIFLFFAVVCSLETFSQKKAELTYPEDSVSDASKKAFDKTFGQGKVLYTLSCGKCHNFKDGKKDVVPDFSLPQLMDYEMRMYQEHSDRLTDKFVTDDEMNKIIMYLRFKTKSGKTVRGEPTPTI